MRALTLLQVFLVGILFTGLLPDVKSGSLVCLMILMAGGIVVFRELRLPDDSRSRKHQRRVLISPHAYVHPVIADRQNRSGDPACPCNFADSASPRLKQPVRSPEPAVCEAAEHARWSEWVLTRADR